MLHAKALSMYEDKELIQEVERRFDTLILSGIRNGRMKNVVKGDKGVCRVMVFSMLDDLKENGGDNA